MWSYSENFPSSLAVHFLDFIDTEEFASYATPGGRHEIHAPTCLLDVILLWVTFGDATEICPTFEIYLLAVFEIIDIWYSPDGKSGLQIWPTSADEFVPLEFLYKSPELKSQAVRMPDISEHSALRKENFEIARTRHQLSLRSN